MIFWPNGNSGMPPRWARVADGRVVEQGSDDDWRAATHLVALPSDEPAMLVVPTSDVTLHWIACPGMTVRQGAAAAPLMALESSIGPAESLHAATQAAPDPDQPHIVAVTSRDAMETWIAWCEEAGVPDAAIVPAATLLPPPDDGFVGGRIGDEDVLRGQDCAVAAHEGHAPMIVGDAPVGVLRAADMERLMVAALAAPPLDLRQGLFAHRRSQPLDPAWMRRVGVLAGGIVLASLLIALVTIVRLHVEASALDDRTVALAARLVPDAVDAGDADSRLTAMLAARGGAGGLTGTVAAVMTAMRTAPGVSMRSLAQMADGSVRVQLAGARAEDINVVLIALQNAGWRVAANGVQQQGAQTVADITVASS
jgi:general secretion pathway protein L